MGIQINGQTDTISSTDGSLNIGGTVTVQVTGDATGLTGTPDITVGTVNASSAVISGDLTVQGTTTTLDTLLTEVDKLEVGANNTNVAVAVTQSGTGDILRLYDGASQVVTVADGGSVGIGTDNPDNVAAAGARNLVIGNNSTSTAGITINTGTGSYQGRINFGRGTTDQSYGYILCDHFNAFMSFGLSNTGEKLRMNSTGNVGIGTDNPGEKLHLTTTSGNCKLRIDAASAASVDFYNSGTRIADMFTDAATSNFTITNRQNASIILRTDGTNERLRITGGGKVGIGEDGPQSTLHVAENIADSTAINWANSQLSVATPYPSNSTKNRATIYFAPYGSDDNYSPAAISATAEGSAASTLKFFTNIAGNYTGQVQTYERLRITSTGNVGVGVTNPGFKLEVAGDVTATGGFWTSRQSTSTSSTAAITLSFTLNTNTTAILVINSANSPSSVQSPGMYLLSRGTTGSAISTVDAHPSVSSVALNGSTGAITVTPNTSSYRSWGFSMIKIN